MTEVVKLKNANENPDEDVVRELENALRLAKSGDLRSVALVGTLTGGENLTAYATDDAPEAIGLLEYLKFTLCMAMPHVGDR
ncbi:MAG: hypothetical protein ACPGSI_18975 [Pikeienuella sp.]